MIGAQMTDEEKERWRERMLTARKTHDDAVDLAVARYHDAVARAYQAGLTQMELSVILGVAPNTVKRILEITKVPSRPVGRRPAPVPSPRVAALIGNKK
jgi:hypothetical protein